VGYQLWTSTVTGHRRRGTRLEDFHAGLSSKITGEAIFEPLRSCPSHAPAIEMQEELARLDFDVAGVRESLQQPVIGFVRRDRLGSGLVRDHVEQISADTLVDQSIGIESLLSCLQLRKFVFVSVGGMLVGILTLADLNKPLVRVYLFGLLSLLEIHLSFWVAQVYQDDNWKSILTPERIEMAARVQVERQRRGQQLPLVDCLQFCDKRELILADDELRGRLRLGSKAKAKKYLGDSEKLRNTLAHSQYDLVEGSTWTSLIDLVQWVAGVIAMSDAAVEARASEVARGYIGALW
jgi:hypothetical protein